MPSPLDAIAAKVKAGKYAELPWGMVEALFPSKNAMATKRKLDDWAKKSNVSYVIEPHTVKAGGVTVIVPTVVFKAAP